MRPQTEQATYAPRPIRPPAWGMTGPVSLGSNARSALTRYRRGVTEQPPGAAAGTASHAGTEIGAGADGGRIEDQHARRPQRRGHVGGQPPHLPGVGDVGPERGSVAASGADAACHRRCRGGVVVVVHRDRGPEAGQQPGGSGADPVAGAGDQRHLPGEQPRIGRPGGPGPRPFPRRRSVSAGEPDRRSLPLFGWAMASRCVWVAGDVIHFAPPDELGGTA
jgi:hypothetical protein